MADYNRRLYLLYLLYLRRKRRSRNRQVWIDPIIKVRYLDGLYYTLFDKLVTNPRKFFNFFRMSKETFDYILVRLSDKIKKQDTRLRMAVPPEEMLAVTIRYLATGATYTEMHYIFRIGISTISGIVNDVCHQIWDTFQVDYLKKLEVEDWETVADEFNRKAHFPVCLGAIDGKHIRVQNFPNSGYMFFNFKKFYSIVLLAIVDSNYKFLFVDIGAYGKDCDSAVLRAKSFWEKLNRGELNIPKAKPITGQGLKVPYVFLGDSAFPLHEHIMKDFSNHNPSIRQRVFNYRLHRARRYVECAFGILSNKWRVFHRPLNVSKRSCINIVKACVILHNIVRTRDGALNDSEFTVATGSCFEPLPVISTTTSTGKNGKGVRSCFSDYFMSTDGQLPWQLSKI